MEKGFEDGKRMLGQNCDMLASMIRVILLVNEKARRAQNMFTAKRVAFGGFIHLKISLAREVWRLVHGLLTSGNAMMWPGRQFGVPVKRHR